MQLEAANRIPTGGLVALANYYVDVHVPDGYGWRTIQSRRPHVETEGAKIEDVINKKVTLKCHRACSFVPSQPVIFKGFGTTRDDRPCLHYLLEREQNGGDYRKVILSSWHPTLAAPVQEPFEGMSI